MIEKNDIIDAYVFLRENNQSIPSETLEFMKDVSLRELEKVKNGRECFSCVHDGFQQIFKSACTGCGAEGELRNFKVKI